MTQQRVTARIEDLFFLDEHGASLQDVDRRLGLTNKALEQFCRRHGVTALYTRFKHRGHMCDYRCPDPMPDRPAVPTFLQEVS